MIPIDESHFRPHSTAETESSHSDNCFDFLRFVAALMVLVSHSFALVGLSEPLVFKHTLGGLGVSIFFVTSGYLIFQSWQRDPSPGRYLVRRSLRIFPALFIVLLITAFVIGPALTTRTIGAYFLEPQTYQYFTNLFFVGSRGLPGVFENNPYPITVNGGLWTLKYEFFMYLFLLSLGVLSNRSKVLLPAGLGVAVAGSVTVALLVSLPLEQIPERFFLHDLLVSMSLELSSTVLRFPELACYFLMGALFGYWRRSVIFSWRLVAILMVASYMLSDWSGAIVPVMCLIAYGSLTFGNAKFYPISKFGKYGDFSYGLYIYGFVVQQSVTSLLGPSPNWAIALLLSFVTTLFLAYVSWNLIEAPALSAKDRLCALITRDTNDATTAEI